MKSTTVNVDPSHVIDEVSPLLFGGFIEHLGRCVYEGVYDPNSGVADEDGFRTDVMAALGELQMTIMRYPGGNFASGYHWEDGIGPRERRPTVRELAWQSLEPNSFGTDEFLKLCGKMQWEPMLAVNLGTGTPEEARNWVEYCNAAAGSQYADQRVANGAKDPYGVKYWCLGNEMDGPWQLGHVPAREYAIRAQQAAKMMKSCDRSIETIACGSSGPTMPTFPEWDCEVLAYVRSQADYISLHRYVGNQNDDPVEYFGTGARIDRQIEVVDATCRYVHAVNRSRRRHYLCFDEWNVWYKDRASTNGEGKIAPALIEEDYNFEDALVVAQFLNSFIRHADTVKIANLAQVVNVIAPLKTRGDELLKQTIFHAFRLFSERKSGRSLRLAVTGDTFDTDNGPVACLDASCIHEPDGGLTFFLINLAPTDKMTVNVNLNGLDATGVTGEILHHTDLKALNTFENPDVVVTNEFADVSLTPNGLLTELPAACLVRLIVEMR